MSIRVAFVLAVLLAATVPLRLQAAETIAWKHPWRQGLALTYATEYTSDKAGAGKRQRTRATDTTAILVTEAGADGYVQAWTSRDARLELLEGDPAALAAARAAARAMDGVALQVELDPDGNFRAIRDLDALAVRLRAALRPMLAGGVDASVAKLEAGKREAARAEADARTDAVLAQMTSPAMLQAMLGRVPQGYNGFVGLELEPGEWYGLDTELENPLGGPPFPARLEFAFSVSEDDLDDVFLEWTQTIDPAAGAEAAWALVERLAGTPIPAGERKGLPKELELADEGVILFRRSSGVIEMFESVRTVKLGEHQEVQRQRLRLTSGDHAHEWADGDAAGEDAAGG